MNVKAITRKASMTVLSGLLCLSQLSSLFDAHAQDSSGAPPIYDDLGDLEYAVTANEAAQTYFNQGMKLYYAFNHAEAIASFREAQRLDPDCAMCWWGESLAWGPNINLAMDYSSALAAFAALQQAQARTDKVSNKEKMLIGALSQRYLDTPADDRSKLDAAYSNAMAMLAHIYPQDDNIVVLYGESVMDLSPWDYWLNEDQLRSGMDTALAGFTTVILRSPNHPGACHFFIHTVEEVQPELALPCAEMLKSLMPGAGHLVHMPGHIYIRVGRYLEAIEANEHAVHADETWMQDRKPAPGMYTGGYYPHNYDFLAFAAMMIGRGEQAIAAADRLGSLIPEEMLHDPSVTFPQHYFMRAAQIRIRFGRWDEILQLPAPGDDLPHAQAIWEYAQGRALLVNGDIAGAKKALQRLHGFANGESLATARLEFNESQKILAIAESVLTGKIAQAEGNFTSAIDHLLSAVEIEDGLIYGEPPEWSVSVRQELGEVFLAAGQAAQAEQTFLADLQNFPDNAWSLAGVANALNAQGKAEAAEQFEMRFHRVWSEGENSPLIE